MTVEAESRVCGGTGGSAEKVTAPGSGIREEIVGIIGNPVGGASHTGIIAPEDYKIHQKMLKYHFPGRRNLKSKDQGRIILHDNMSNRWLKFSSPVKTFSAYSLKEVLPSLEEINRLVENERFHAAGFISYEAAPAFDEALTVRPDGDFPLLWFGLYNRAEEISLPEAEDKKQDPAWEAEIDRPFYTRDIARIKKQIREGNSYQVNYTYRLRSRFSSDSFNFFLRMQGAQKARYGAFIDLPEWALCSASPELFFSLEGNRIRTRPMKGTAPRGLTAEEDREQADWLYHSEKNRAENRMIVDMIRNDLGRIARPGTVEVSRLFTLEKYPTLWQMTSSVEADSSASLPEILKALFPCASITGAPKCSTMAIIKELEQSPRRIYTGSIGFISPGRKAQFNVAIRTALISKKPGEAEYGTGGGVVWDSTAGEEFEETRTKARILTKAAPPFSLLETLKWEPSVGYILLERHLKRLKESAEYFSYPFRRDEILNLLIRQSSRFPGRHQRVRLLLKESGELSCEEKDYYLPACWTLTAAAEAVDSRNPFLYHKTSNREVYEKQKALHPETDDVLLWNERGEITESCIANVVVVLKGEHLTPPVSCGLLAGTYRQELLENAKIKERVLTLEDLKQAERIYLINSVRGVQEVVFKF